MNGHLSKAVSTNMLGVPNNLYVITDSQIRIYSKAIHLNEPYLFYLYNNKLRIRSSKTTNLLSQLLSCEVFPPLETLGKHQTFRGHFR